jgi:multidrug resistance efflux pump
MSSSQNANVARIVSEPADAEGRAEKAVVTTAEAPRASQTPANTQEAAGEKKKKRGLALPIIGLALLAGGAWYGYNWWTTGRFMVSTDDAYIGGDIATISPKVTGYVAKVNAVANQQVKAGDVLATLDDGDYKIALAQAEASLDTEKLSLSASTPRSPAARPASTKRRRRRLPWRRPFAAPRSHRPAPAICRRSPSARLHRSTALTSRSIRLAPTSSAAMRPSLRQKQMSRFCTPSDAKLKARSANSRLPATRPRAICPLPF